MQENTGPCINVTLKKSASLYQIVYDFMSFLYSAVNQDAGDHNLLLCRFLFVRSKGAQSLHNKCLQQFA